MRTSNKMAKVITQIAKKHGLDLAASEAHLRLEMPGYDRLVIEKIGRNLVSVAHYYEINGDLVAEPDVVFFIGKGHWIPIEITQSLTGYSRYGLLTEDGSDLEAISRKGVEDLTDFTEMWATNLEDQGWLEAGERTS
jgi:hypothetical protein